MPYVLPRPWSLGIARAAGRGPIIDHPPAHARFPKKRVRGSALAARARRSILEDAGEDMTTPILVTGGTGTLGSRVTRRLREAGRPFRVLTRRAGRAEAGPLVTGDLATGEGVEAALSGVETVIHCAGTNKGDDEKARHLMRAAERAGARHVVFISVVGADRIPIEGALDRAMFGYFASKLAAERVVAASSVSWTTLRATQFYDLVLKVCGHMARLPIVPVGLGFRFQPVDTDEVAARLVELALGPPAGMVPDLAGPRVAEMAELMRTYLAVTHQRRIVLPVWVPGKAARAVRAGAIVAPDRAVGVRTWDAFLADVERGGLAGAGRPPLTSARAT
jgi:uncharacterized protein YbjT (DUF2867 family)